MSSMLRQNYVKMQDLSDYLRGYDPAKPQSAEDWSKQESAGFETGMLLFCLERVSAPSGLALGKKESSSEGETFRVKDLSVVVGLDDSKSLVVNITASAYELRYLEVLLLEKARKAILDGKDFLYVAVRPRELLSSEKVREIEELRANYAQGGSRRSLVGDPSGAQEPLQALLAALGVRLSLGGIGRQALDIGAICHMLFAPESRQEDKNKAMVKGIFIPIPNSEPIANRGYGGQPQAPAAQSPASVGPEYQAAAEAAPQAMQWGPPPTSSWTQDVTPAATTWAGGEPQAETAWSQDPIAPSPWGQDAAPQAVAPGFAVEPNLPPQAPALKQWFQKPPTDAAFGADSPGLNPFAPAAEAPAAAEPEVDYASQFRSDAEDGLSGQPVADGAQEQEMRWGQEGFSQQYSSPPDAEFAQPAQQELEQSGFGAQQPAAQFSPPADEFTTQNFNDQHFQAPDFSHTSSFSESIASPTVGSESSWPGDVLPNVEPPSNAWMLQGGFDRTTTSSSELPAFADVFQPPYEGSEHVDEPALPSELTQRLDPENQLFQTAEAAAESEALVPPPAFDAGAVDFQFATPQELPPPTNVAPFQKSSWSTSFSEQAAEANESSASALRGLGAVPPEPTDQAPTLFERLNTQLHKGSDTVDQSGQVQPANQNVFEFQRPEPSAPEVPPAPPPPPPPPPATGFSKKGAPQVLEWPTAAPEPEVSDWTTSAVEPVSADPYKGLAEAISGAGEAPPTAAPIKPSFGLKGESTLKINVAQSTGEDTLQNESPYALAAPDAVTYGETLLSPQAEPETFTDAPYAVPEATSQSTGLQSDFAPSEDTGTSQSSEPAEGGAAAPSFDGQAGWQDVAVVTSTPWEVEQTVTEPSTFSEIPQFVATEATVEAPAEIAAAADFAAPDIVAAEANQSAIAPAVETPAIELPVVEEEEEEEEEEDARSMPALSRKGFQQPRLVMNEMAGLMSKLEQQVQKAAKKLGSRSEEVKLRLGKQVDALIEEASSVEKDNQKSISNLTQRLSKQLDDVSEEVRLKVSDVAANGRYTIKQLLTSNQNQVDDSKNTLYEALRDACKTFRVDTEALLKKTETELNELVRDRTTELEDLIKSMNTTLDETSTDYSEKLAARFERFKARMAEESSSVIRALERNVKSMIEEIDGSWDRASEKLKSSKSDFEQTIHNTVNVSELTLSYKTRTILTGSLVPRLKDGKNKLRRRTTDLSKRFSDESEGQASGQLLGLEASLSAARQQLQTLVEECMSNLDTVGRNQQAGLEDLFKEASTHAEKATTEVTDLLKRIETEITENETACKRLAETSTIDSDPELTEARTTTTARVQQLKQHANVQLMSAIDDGCAKLDGLSHRVHTETNSVLQEQSQSVREAAENGVLRMRDAIQDAFNAIQSAREKYME